MPWRHRTIPGVHVTLSCILSDTQVTDQGDHNNQGWCQKSECYLHVIQDQRRSWARGLLQCEGHIASSINHDALPWPQSAHQYVGHQRRHVSRCLR